MMNSFHRRHINPWIKPLGSMQSPRRQKGVALAVSLILLILVTTVGLSSIRSTTVQQKMASNLYDRNVAMQNAEAALHVAIEAYEANPTATNLIWHNCQEETTKCLGNPFDDASLPAVNIHTVASGTTATTYTASSVAVGQPQYVMEHMGSYGSGSGSGTGQQSTSAENEGNDQIQTGQGSTFIRITVRSADPATAGADSRAIVILQTILRQ